MKMGFYQRPKPRAEKRTVFQVKANCGGAHGLCPKCEQNGNEKGCGKVFGLKATWSRGR